MKVLLLALITLAAFGQSSAYLAVGNPSNYTDSSGHVYLADTLGQCTGTAFSTSSVISGTTDPTLYQYGRYDAQALACSLPINVGVYRVTMKFAETRGATLGKRIMNLYLNGTTQKTGFDIYGTTNRADVAYDVVVPAYAALTGSITVMASQVTGGAQLNAIAIEPLYTAVSMDWVAQVTNKPFYDVREYGCSGNGIHDDTTCLQTAITAAGLAGGGEVFLPAGTYKTTSALAITLDNVQIRGAGYATKIAPAFTTGQVFNFDGPSHPAGVGSRNVIRDLYIHAASSTGTLIGIFLNAQADFEVSNIFIWAVPNGIWLTGASAGVVDNIRHYNYSLNGVVAEGLSGFTLSRSKFYGTFGSQPFAGVVLSHAVGVTLTGNDFAQVGYGVLINPGNSQRVVAVNSTNNWYDSCKDGGMRIAPTGSGFTTLIKSTGDWFNTNGNYGLTVAGAVTASAFVNFQAAANDAGGVYLGGAVSDIDFTNGQVSGNGRYRHGLVDVTGTGTTVTYVSGGLGGWQDYYVGGTITIAGSPYTIASVQSSSVLTISTPAATGTGVAFSIGAVNVYSGFYIAANTSNFRISGGVSGQFAYYENTQKYGVEIVAGTGNKYYINNINLLNNVTAPISDGGTGALRAVHPGYSNHKSITDYGALCDSSHDDSAAINACLASIPAGGGVCYVPAGNCIAQSIEVAGVGWFLVGQPAAHSVGTALQGASRIVQKAGANADYVLRFSASLSGIRDVVVDGNKANNTTAKDGILIEGASRVDIQNVTVQNAKRNALRIISTAEESCCAKIISSMFIASDSSNVYCVNTSDFFITQSEFENAGSHGMELVSCNTWRISNSDFGGNTENGLKWTGTTGHGSGGLQLGNNQFGGNLKEDILIYGYDGGAQVSGGNVIHGNYFLPSPSRVDNTYSAIKIVDSPANSIVGNAIRATADYKYGIEMIETVGGRASYNNIGLNSYDGSFGTYPVLTGGITNQIANGIIPSVMGAPFAPLSVVFTDLASFAAATYSGTVLWCADCTTAAICAGSGSGHLAVSNGTNWTCQ